MRNRLINGVAAAALAGTLTFGLSACGSDDNGDTGQTDTSDSALTTQAATTGDSGTTATNNAKKNKDRQGDEVTPGKKAPNSAGDKKKNAPDDAISDRPGGPGRPIDP